MAFCRRTIAFASCSVAAAMNCGRTGPFQSQNYFFDQELSGSYEVQFLAEAVGAEESGDAKYKDTSKAGTLQRVVVNRCHLKTLEAVKNDKLQDSTFRSTMSYIRQNKSNLQSDRSFSPIKIRSCGLKKLNL